MDNGITIGKAAAHIGVGVETIRFYERKGLLEQVPKDSSGYRRFDGNAMKRIRFIRRAKELGFTLSEIQELLDLRVDDRRTCDDVRSVVEQKLKEVDERVRSLQEIETALGSMAELCSRGGPQGACPILEALDRD